MDVHLYKEIKLMIKMFDISECAYFFIVGHLTCSRSLSVCEPRGAY